MFEQMLFILFLAAFFLLPTLLKWLMQRWRQPPQGEPPRPPTPATAPRLQPVRTAVARRVPSGSLNESSLLMEVPRRRASRAQAYVGNRQDVRRGVILMTLLGPCRALEPPPPVLRSGARGV